MQAGGRNESARIDWPKASFKLTKSEDKPEQSEPDHRRSRSPFPSFAAKATVWLSSQAAQAGLQQTSLARKNAARSVKP